MSGGREGEQLFARVPEELKYLADQDDRQLKEIVTAALETELGVTADDSVAVIDRQIVRLEDELEEARATLERQRKRVQDIQDELEEARNIRAEKAASTEDYEQRLDELLDTLAGDSHPDRVWAKHPTVTDIAADVDRSRDEVHLDLQQRAADQRRELTVGAFKDGSKATQSDRRTPIWEKWDDGTDDGGDGA